MKREAKGMSHADFVIAASLFIIVFAAVLQTMTTFFENAESTAEIAALTGKSLSMLGLVDYGTTPPEWQGAGNISRLGLASKSYTFFIAVNNTKRFLINQSQNVTILSNELVNFNYTDMGFDGVDVNSTSIYNDGAPIAYNIDGARITFSASAGANETEIYTVYFDDDSNFTSASTAVSGANTLNEISYPTQELYVMQYRKISSLNNSNYTQLAGYLNVGNFRVNIYDLDEGRTFLDFGGEAPLKGNIVALQRYALFQNETGGIHNGRIIVKSW